MRAASARNKTSLLLSRSPCHDFPRHLPSTLAPAGKFGHRVQQVIHGKTMDLLYLENTQIVNCEQIYDNYFLIGELGVGVVAEPLALVA